ncbi:MAG TPA: hypothetical protein VJB97_04485 [Candidatus Paceibacterota bacterium]
MIELLVVIAIIGILSSVVLASLNSARAKGRDSKRISDMKQLQLALELYYDTNSGYPAAIFGTELTGPGYIPAVPLDPTAATTPYVYSGATAADATCSTAPCASYVIRANLEDVGHSALDADEDADVGTVDDCTDPTDGFYCVRP